MDDSFNDESFRCGSPGSGRSTTATHGALVSRNSSKSTSQASAGRPSEYRVLHAMPESVGPSTEEETFPPPPSRRAQLQAQPNNIPSDAGSGVLVGDSELSYGFVPLSHKDFTSSQNKAGSITTQGPRQPVAVDGSPLQRGSSDRHSNGSLTPSLLDFATSSNGSKQGSQYTHKSPDAWDELECSKLAGWTVPPAMHASCYTETPAPSEDVTANSVRCAFGCWGCHLCCPSQFGPSHEFLGRDWHNPAMSARPPSVIYSDGDHSLSGQQGCADAYFSDGAPEVEDRPVNMSRGRESRGEQVNHVAHEAANGPHANRADNTSDLMARLEAQNQIIKQLQLKEAMLNNRINSPGPNVDITRNIAPSSIGRDTEERHVQSDSKASGPPGLTKTHANTEHNKIWNIVSNDGNGQRITGGDLDLRDLSKQVLRMNMYEKFKREQSLLDRLGSIEQKLARSGVTSENAGGRARQSDMSMDTAGLRDYLSQQAADIEASKRNLAVYPDMQYRLANLNEEAGCTAERLQALENKVYDVQVGYGGPQVYRYDDNNDLGEQRAPEHDQMGYDSTVYQQHPGYAEQSARSFYGEGQGGVLGWGATDGASVQGGGWGATSNTPRDEYGYKRKAPSPCGWGRPPSVDRSSKPYAPTMSSYRSDVYRSGNGWDRGPSIGNGWGTPPSIDNGRNMSASNRSFGRAYTIYEDDYHYAPTSRQIEHSGPRSSKYCGRSPTVETVIDEDDNSSQGINRTLGSSWQTLGSQRHGGSTRGSIEGGWGQASRTDGWCDVSPQHFAGTGSGRSVNARGRFGRDRAPPPSAWERDGGWGGSLQSRPASSRASRDHWRCSKTPSKWEGETGDASGSTGGW